MLSAVLVLGFLAVSAFVGARLNRRMKNRNSAYHRGAQAAALDHLRFGTPAAKPSGRGRFRLGYRRYSRFVHDVRQRAHKVAIKDAERLLREQRAAYTVAAVRVGGDRTHVSASGLPEAITRQVDITGGIEWPEWVHTELENLGYGALDRRRADADRSTRVDRLFADAALGRTRRWLRYESPVEQNPGAIEVIHRVQGSTIALLRRHAALVASARGWAPTPPDTPVAEYADAVHRVAAWLRVYGYFDAEVTGDQLVNVVGGEVVASVVVEPRGYRTSADDLNPLVAAASASDRLAVLVLYNADGLDPLLLAAAAQQGVALFVLATTGRMAPGTRPAQALAARAGGVDRVPWPLT